MAVTSGPETPVKFGRDFWTKRKKQKVNLFDLINQTAWSLEDLIEEKNIEFQLRGRLESPILCHETVMSLAVQGVITYMMMRACHGGRFRIVTTQENNHWVVTMTCCTKLPERHDLQVTREHLEGLLAHANGIVENFVQSPFGDTLCIKIPCEPTIRGKHPS